MYTHIQYRLQIETWLGTRFAVSTVRITTDTRGRSKYYRLKIEYCHRDQLWEVVDAATDLIGIQLAEDEEKREYQPDLVTLTSQEDHHQHEGQPGART